MHIPPNYIYLLTNLLLTLHISCPAIPINIPCAIIILGCIIHIIRIMYWIIPTFKLIVSQAVWFEESLLVPFSKDHVFIQGLTLLIIILIYSGSLLCWLLSRMHHIHFLVLIILKHVLFILPHPEKHLLLVGSLPWVDLLQLIDSLATYLFLTADFNVKHVFKCFEVQVSGVGRSQKPLVVYFIIESKLSAVLLELHLSL